MIKVNVYGLDVEIAGDQPNCPWCGQKIDDISVKEGSVIFECLEGGCACDQIRLLSADLNEAIQIFSTRKEPAG